MLCISTSKWVLPMPFAGGSHVFDAETTFSIFFNVILPKGVTLKSWLTPGENFFFLSFFPLVMEKDEKACFSVETNDFNQ